MSILSTLLNFNYIKRIQMYEYLLLFSFVKVTLPGRVIHEVNSNPESIKI